MKIYLILLKYILNAKFDCTFKYKVSYLSFVKKIFVAIVKRVYPLRRASLFAWVSPLLGRKKLQRFTTDAMCRRLQEPAE
jgi:hypothetical protein